MCIGALVAVVSLLELPVQASDLLDLTPAEVVAGYVYTPSGVDKDPTASPNPKFSMIPMAADLARQVGLLSRTDPQTQFWTDLIAAFLSVAELPHALVLFDVDAAELAGGGHRLSGLNAALIVQTGRENHIVEARIQRVLSLHTNTEQTKLNTDRADGWTVNVIRDRRLPDWVIISSARFEGYCVVTVGEAALKRVQQTFRDRSTSIAGHRAWAAMSSAAGTSDPLWRLLIDVERLRRTQDAALRAKTNAVLEALQMADVDRGLWTVAYDGRAVLAATVSKHGDSVSVTHFAAKQFRGLPADRFVPATAGSFALIDCNVPAILRGATRAYLSTQSEAYRAAAGEFLKSLESESGVSMDRDILDRLDSCIVIHDEPRHAFGLPLLWTVQFRIGGDAGSLRAAIDKFLTALQTRITEPSFIRLNRDPDGAWYLSFGIAGPALMVVDDWIVVSFSPQAVRQAVSAINSIRDGARPGP